jgi:hypothetical protein
MASRTARLLAVAILAFAAGACSTKLDTEGLEPQLQDQIEAKTGSTITGVDCPGDVKVETGLTFQCTATEESGATFTVEVVQTNDAGNVTWKFTDAQPEATGSDGATGSTGPTGASGA